MNNLAIAYVTCDKYEHVWAEWYEAFLLHWWIDVPVYWCGESRPPISIDFINLFHPPVEADRWTTKLRKQLEYIQQENIFIWLDDEIQQKNIDEEFRALYNWFVKHKADSLRIMSRASKANYMVKDTIFGRPLYKLKERSPYLVSFSPNIYRKDFLLEVLSKDESPWSCELNSQNRITNKNIYAYHINDWFINRVVQ